MEFPKSIMGQKELEGMISSFNGEKAIIFKAVVTFSFLQLNCLQSDDFKVEFYYLKSKRII